MSDGPPLGSPSSLGPPDRHLTIVCTGLYSTFIWNSPFYSFLTPSAMEVSGSRSGMRAWIDLLLFATGRRTSTGTPPTALEVQGAPPADPPTTPTTHPIRGPHGAVTIGESVRRLRSCVPQVPSTHSTKRLCSDRDVWLRRTPCAPVSTSLRPHPT